MSDNPFNILGKESTPINQGEAVSGADKSQELNIQIETLIKSADLFLFMKGTPDMPMCGFSANTIAMLNSVGKPYKTFNILEDMDIREGLKAYSNWPTYPQLYFKGELVGGNDIITEMFQSGQLQEILNS
ncbi:Grx4 family monothiol glutaredoxin [Bacteriovorax sp. BAL6_X]|uniref:Grx4 family monothiol glutaredoxin n=1 Tax=Bacteriovoracales TaxID=2024979 RepID=UPI000385BB72|nr:Grx4 family monothiol glutaredoxin [Bacteriovorax sp. BAL6_X]EPZ52450.1 monothiol glutaredoxin, Grx4 family [Bacteriovorax sp. BAL6_X]